MPRWRDLELAVEKFLTLKGYKFWHVRNYRCYRCGAVGNSGAAGMPDYITYYPEVLFIECKTGKGRLSEDQKEVMKTTPAEYIVVRDNIDELVRIFKINKAWDWWKD